MNPVSKWIDGRRKRGDTRRQEKELEGLLGCHVDLSDSFKGNAFTAHLVPKNDPTPSGVLHTSLFAESREDALERVNKDPQVDHDKYEVVITNGISMRWRDE